MATLTIRNLDDEVHAALRVRAAQHGRSMEEEVRQVLSEATRGALASAARRQERVQAALEQMREALRAANGGVLPTGVVDELIAERRAEAEREWREAAGEVEGE